MPKGRRSVASVRDLPRVTRQDILRSAEKHFAARGYEGARLEDIGSDLGIGRPLILYHFGSKRDLYDEVLNEVFMDIAEQVGAVVGAEGPLISRMQAAVGLSIEYLAGRPAVANLILRESVNADPDVRERVRETAKPAMELLAASFEEGKRTGELGPECVDVGRFFSAVAGAMFHYVAVMPTFVADLEYEPLDAANVERFRRDLVRMTRLLLNPKRRKPVRELKRGGKVKGRKS